MWSMTLAFILGCFAGPYFVKLIDLLEAKWYSAHEPKQIMLGRLPYNFDPR